ncbi:MAG: glycoside hydrolase family 43 protein [Rikenellaceae bacterium]
MKKIFLTFMAAVMASASLLAQAPTTFKNPILSGFHPDPSITRVGDTYYLVNSTFEWFPGLPVHKSKDLVNWELAGYAISRPEQTPFKDGLPDSGGMFAPTIRYHEGLFYVICTAIGAGGNFIVTAKDPAGEWSDPIWLKDAPGIDPSLYWEDGRCYYAGNGNLNPKVDKWYGKAGVWMQEVDVKTGKMIGERVQLTFGHATNARWTEGPHIYKVGDTYLLMVAEGGTGEFHSTTVYHSKELFGPYTTNQVNPVLTHRHLGYTYPITQPGHTDLIQTQNGDWWAVMLGKRPVERNCMLARETFLTKVEMTYPDGELTPMFNPGVGLVQLEQERPDLPWTPVPARKVRDDFDSQTLDSQWNFLRTPMSSWYKIENGEMVINLRSEVITKLVNPSLIAQRVKTHRFTSSTKVTFSTKKDNEKAGFVYYRNSKHHFQLLKSKDRVTLIKSFVEYGDKPSIIVKTHSEVVAEVPYTANSVVFRVVAEGIEGQFFYGESVDDMKPIGGVQDISIIGDEKALKFNGSYIGMYATSDGQTSTNKAKFDWFEQIPACN